MGNYLNLITTTGSEMTTLRPLSLVDICKDIRLSCLDDCQNYQIYPATCPESKKRIIYIHLESGDEKIANQILTKYPDQVHNIKIVYEAPTEKQSSDPIESSSLELDEPRYYTRD
jgi:hypothetical protein